MLGLAGALLVALSTATAPTSADQTAVPASQHAAPQHAAPQHAVAVYDYAAANAPCTVDWTVLGGIAGVASNHGVPDPDGSPAAISDVGTSTPRIVGLPLDGAEGRALIEDTDDGELDASDTLDHAVGPFQFIPQTWELYGTDGNGDGEVDPQNFWDAAASAAALLCDKGVEGDLDGALTAYFGTDQWNDWAGRRREELVIYRRARAEALADVPAPVLQRIAVASPVPEQTRASADSQDAAGPATSPEAQQAQASAPSAAPWFAPTHQLLNGDWDGDGAIEAGAFEITDSGGRFVHADGEGRPYGRPLVVDEFLPKADLEQIVLHPFVGDWDSDGRQTPGLVILANGEGEILLFDGSSQLVERSDLGPTDPVALSFEIVSGPPARDGPEPVFLREVTAHDGSVLRLFDVENITVAESIAQQISDMVGAAAVDGIKIEAWGWRSHEQQLALRRQNCADVWTTPASACSPPTAIPGTSRHEFGLALDFHVGGTTIGATSPVFAWLEENAETYGLENLPSEPWHWSVDGG